jgi:hypothetical protein
MQCVKLEAKGWGRLNPIYNKEEKNLRIDKSME